MQSAIVIRGRLIGPTNVELDEPVSDLAADVEVIVRPRPANEHSAPNANILDFLRQLPPGTRTREDIDAQIREEREGWNDR
jgi:hypothetical protein